MSSQYIAFAKTTVSPEKTAAEIEEMLRKADVQKVGKVYEAVRDLAALLGWTVW